MKPVKSGWSDDEDEKTEKKIEKAPIVQTDDWDVDSTVPPPVTGQKRQRLPSADDWDTSEPKVAKISTDIVKSDDFWDSVSTETAKKPNGSNNMPAEVETKSPKTVIGIDYDFWDSVASKNGNGSSSNSLPVSSKVSEELQKLNKDKDGQDDFWDSVKVDQNLPPKNDTKSSNADDDWD